MELAYVDRDLFLREVVDDSAVSERMDAHADRCAVGVNLSPEGLENADLRGPLRFVLIPDYPERDHVVRIGDGSRTQLEHAVLRRVQRSIRLLLANHETLAEAM